MRKKWGFLDWLGLIAYLVGWMTVVSSPAQAQGIPSTFVPASPYHVILYAYLAVVGGLMYSVSPAVGLAAFAVLPVRPQPLTRCPLYLRVWNEEGPHMLTPSNASRAKNVGHIQLIYAAPPGTRNARICRKPVLLYAGPVCCFLYQCEGAYYNPYPEVRVANLTDEIPAGDVELMLLPSGEPMIYYRASLRDGRYDITCQGLVGEEVYLAMMSATMTGAAWVAKRLYSGVRGKRMATSEVRESLRTNLAAYLTAIDPLAKFTELRDAIHLAGLEGIEWTAWPGPTASF